MYANDGTRITNATIAWSASGGTIVDTGGFNPNVRGFNYGTTTSYGSTTQETGSFGVGPFSGTVTNLTCGTKYHYQSYATNSVGSGYGSDAVFDTVSCASDMGGNALFGLESMNEATRVPTVTSTIELPPSQNSSFTRNLRVGMTGEDIKALQAYLNTHGHIIAKTGPGSLGNETAKFGLKTESALMSFQKENGLPSDGVAGPETWAKMK